MSDGAGFDYCRVAFLDVLGWTVATREAVRDNELFAKMRAAIQPYQPVMIGGSRQIGVDPEISQFSDSVILTLSLNDGRHERSMMFWNHLFRICETCFENGFYVRGGVADGPMYHEGPRAFGPALLDAIDAEKLAQFPRIIVTDRANDPENVLTRTPDDGRFHFDYLRYNRSGSADLRDPDARADLALRNDQRRVQIAANLEWHVRQKSREDVIAKYIWFARYFNAVADQLGIGQIDIERILALATGTG